MRAANLLLLPSTLLIIACSGSDSRTCGDGTVAKGTECVLVCGEGTTWSKGRCVPACGPGTEWSHGICTAEAPTPTAPSKPEPEQKHVDGSSFCGDGTEWKNDLCVAKPKPKLVSKKKAVQSKTKKAVRTPTSQDCPPGSQKIRCRCKENPADPECQLEF